MNFHPKYLKENTTEKDKIILRTISEVMSDFRDYCSVLPVEQQNFSLNCHIICRALEPFIKGVEFVDGYYVGINIKKKTDEEKTSLCHCNHSWLKTSDDAIIDIYPVGFITMCPILVATKGYMASFGASIYLEDPSLAKEIMNRNLWRNTEVIKKHLKESVKITKQNHRDKKQKF